MQTIKVLYDSGQGSEFKAEGSQVAGDNLVINVDEKTTLIVPLKKVNIIEVVTDAPESGDAT